MYFHRRGLRFLSFASTVGKGKWDPTVSLELNHPTLVLLEKCSSRDHFKQILAQMIRNNLIGQTFPMSRLILYSSTSHPENLDMAILLFSYFTPRPNLYIYNTMISALSFSVGQAIGMYNSMLRTCTWPDKHTLLYLLKAASHVPEAMQIHCHAIVLGLMSYGYLQNSLMKLYMETGQIVFSKKVFLLKEYADVASFNIMIVGYAKKGYSLEAINLFHKMVNSGLEPDEFTTLGLLVCCGQLADVQLGKCVHAWMQRRNQISSSNLILGNALLDMYVKCKDLQLARRTFDGLEVKDAVSWNTMMSGLAKIGELESACTLFNRLPNKDLISWNSLIGGCAQNGDYMMVRQLFINMINENVKPDNVTLLNLVSAVAEVGVLGEGRCIHGVVKRMGTIMDEFLGSALIDMYCKCGSIEKAFTVFKEVRDKDVTVWTAMMAGFAFHGYGRKALKLFSDMQGEVIPNKVTFVAVLTACSHCGLVVEGLNLFNSMKETYGIEPGIEHYGCLVDLFARSGRLVEAKGVIEKMPMTPSRSIWGAILSACRAQGNLEMAEVASRELLKLEPEKEGGYVLLSNIYAATKKWSYSDKIREIMESRGVKKTAGCSSVFVEGAIHDFVAADKCHPRWFDIKNMLISLNSEMKLAADFPGKFLEQLLEAS